GFDGFFLCHCQRCRKDSGSAHASNLFSATARLQWLCGEDRVTRYRLPDTRHSRAFCAICGSALPVWQGNDELLLVPAGSLDDEPGIRPSAHIFVADRAGWDEQLSELPCLMGPPAR